MVPHADALRIGDGHVRAFLAFAGGVETEAFGLRRHGKPERPGARDEALQVVRRVHGHGGVRLREKECDGKNGDQ